MVWSGQYLSSKSYISIDWKRIGGRYDSTFASKAAPGEQPKPPTVQSLYNWFVSP
jgi:hypothetical protein